MACIDQVILISFLKHQHILRDRTMTTSFKRKLIGTGTFTKAYQVGENEVEVVSFCPAKECYALFSQGNTFAPVMERVDYLDSGAGVYAMPLYPKVAAPKKQLNAESYSVYKVLRDISGKWDMNYNKFCDLVNTSTLLNDIKEAVLELADDVSNAIDCYDFGFEISPRNISVKEDGSLVMLDCFFSRKLLRSTLSGKR